MKKLFLLFSLFSLSVTAQVNTAQLKVCNERGHVLFLVSTTTFTISTPPYQIDKSEYTITVCPKNYTKNYSCLRCSTLVVDSERRDTVWFKKDPIKKDIIVNPKN